MKQTRKGRAAFRAKAKLRPKEAAHATLAIVGDGFEIPLGNDEFEGIIKYLVRNNGRRGRPPNEDVQNEREAANTLHAKRPELSYGRIAKHVCRKRIEPNHECDKRCADRIGKLLTAK